MNPMVIVNIGRRGDVVKHLLRTICTYSERSIQAIGRLNCAFKGLYCRQMIPLRDDIPTRHFPIVTIVLIAANVAVYVYQLTLTGYQYQAMIFKWGFIPIEYTKSVQVYEELAVPYGVTAFTSMFVHGGFMHLAGNMLYLWIFGNNIEDYLGKVKFIIFYLVSGAAALGLFTLTSPHSQVPLVGASGAIAGVLGAYVALYPRARVLALVFLGFFIQTVRVPAFILLGFWFVLQILYGLPSLLADSQGGGVAWFAHVGGFVFGYLLFKLTGKKGEWSYQ
jgi:membrane associated rhomboid family serine protease